MAFAEALRISLCPENLEFPGATVQRKQAPLNEVDQRKTKLRGGVRPSSNDII